MDLFTCAGLSIIEAVLVAKLQSAAIFPSLVSGISVLFVTQYLVLKYYRIFLYHKYFSPLRHLPGPKGGHFFLGQTINLLKAETPASLYNEWMREWPDASLIRYLGVGNSEVLVPNSLNAYKEVLQTQCYSFRKPDWFMRMVREVIGKGLLAQGGAEHRAHRKMLNHPFSANNIRKLEPLFKAKARGISSVFDEVIAAGDDGGKTGVIDCTETFSKATLDIMGVCILGQELSLLTTVKHGGKTNASKSSNSLSPAEYTFHQAYHVFFAPGQVGKLLTFFNGFFPTRWLPVEANAEFKFAMKWLNETLTKLVRDRYRKVRQAKESGKYDSSDSGDLATFIVEESLPGGSAEGIQEEEFVGHLLQFMAAGHDTSANVLSWCLLIMAQRQDIQDLLRAEITDLLSRGEDPLYAEIDTLAYLDNFIKETLRHYSPATSYHRQANHDLTIEGVFIPNDTCFDVIPSMAMMNPLIWGNDVDLVDPTRWDRLSGEQLNPFAFGAFSNGPRICIGKQFANMEIKTILVEMIRHYRFIGVEKEFTVENPNLTLRPAGLEIRLQKIG